MASNGSRAQSAWRGRGRGHARAAPTNSNGQRGRGGGSAFSQNRKMELVASISRSSGLQADGDTLKDFKIQEQYWVFVLEKLSSYWDKYESGPDSSAHQRDEARHSILILFRKLREGAMASKRQDAWTIVVYEVSLYISILFASPMQTTSSLSHLTPRVYSSMASPKASGDKTYTSDHETTDQQASAMLALVHSLVSTYPSQSLFREQMRSTLDSSVHDSVARRWIRDLASALRSRNYHRLRTLTQPRTYNHFIKERTSQAPLPAGMTLSLLARRAMATLLSQLLIKARESAWQVLRSAYPLFSCQSGSETRLWLSNCLMLPSEERTKEAVPTEPLDRWLEDRAKAGEVERKENIDGRWIVRKKV